MTDLEQKIYNIIKTHPEFNESVAVEELRMMAERDVTKHVYVLYQQLEKKKAGNKNVLNSWIVYWLGATTERPQGSFTLERRRTYGRKGFPDIDMDFDYLRRHEIIEYLIDKYGRDHVGSIGTIQKLQTKAAIRRAIKVLDPANCRKFDANGKEERSERNDNFVLENQILQSFGERNYKSAKIMTPDGEVVKSVKDAYNKFPDFKRYMDAYPQVAKFASRLEGTVVAWGSHPAGIVVSPMPLAQICPLHFTQDTLETLDEDEKSTKTVATQFTMADVESLGLIKFDVLGLSTKTAISWAVETIKNNHGIELDVSQLPLDDKETLDLIRSSKTVGVFQLESGGMRNAIRELHVDNFDDLVTVIAMFRPGPMDYIGELGSRKTGRIPVRYSHPLMKAVTEKTFGILVYQEQIMQAFMLLADLTATDGYDFMKGCAKKKADLIDKGLEKFSKGAVAKGIGKDVIDKISSDMRKFGGYAFNKSHAASYAYESWKTAYLKAHYPTEFFEARLSVENIRRQFDLVDKYEADAVKNFGFKILPPDLNQSKTRYSIVGERVIRKPMLVKGIGRKAANEIVAKQPYRGSDILFDFANRVGNQVNTKVVEAMWDAGLWPKYKKAHLLRAFEQIKKDKRTNKGRPSDDMFE